MDRFYAYMLVDPRNNQPFYVGKAGGANTMHRWHFDNCKEKATC